MQEEVTTKKLLKDSIFFHVLCLLLVITLIGGITEAIMYNITDCGSTYISQYECYEFFTNKHFQCSSGYTKYCCSRPQSNCNDPGCSIKPYDKKDFHFYQPCQGHQILMWVMFSLSFFCLVLLVAVTRKFSQIAIAENLKNFYKQAKRNYQPPELTYYPNQQRMPHHSINVTDQGQSQEPMLR